MRHRWSGLLVVGLLLAGLVIAGCGGGGDSTSSGGETASETSAEGGGEASGTANIAKAEELVAKYEQTSGVEWPQPTEKFKPGSGKLAIIACSDAAVGCITGAKEATKAAKAMGWTASPTFDGEFNPSKQGGFVQQAIQEGYEGIVLTGIDVHTIASAVDAAAAKHIPITCVMCYSPGFEGKVIDATTGGVIEGKAIGDWVVANSNGHAKIIAYDDKAFPIVAARRENAEGQIEELCPECEIKDEEYPSTDLEKAGAPTFEGLLSAEPPGSFEFVMAPYDPAASTFTKAAQQAGREEFKITGYDAATEFVEQIVNEEPPTAGVTTGSPFPYASWVAVDQIGRVVRGLEPWDSSELPSALITKNNGAELLESGGFFKPADFDYEAMFKEMWEK